MSFVFTNETNEAQSTYWIQKKDVLLLPFRIFLAPTTSTHIPLSQFSTVVTATCDQGRGIFFLYKFFRYKLEILLLRERVNNGYQWGATTLISLCFDHLTMVRVLLINEHICSLPEGSIIKVSVNSCFQLKAQPLGMWSHSHVMPMAQDMCFCVC